MRGMPGIARSGPCADAAMSDAPAGMDRWVLAAILVVGAATLFRISYLLTSPLDLDYEEAQYWLWAQSLDWGYFSKPPVVAWIIAVATSLCGDGEACVRIASPLLHAATALVLGVIGRDLGGPLLGFWAAVGYALAPGVSFSAGLMTTDVPLLLFWSLALLCVLRLLRSGRFPWAIGAGVAIGIGMLSKYTMLLFPASLVLYLAISAEVRARITPLALVVMAAVAGALFAPNLLWNLEHGWSTVRHTAILTGLGDAHLDPRDSGMFVLSQLALLGPVYFTVLAVRMMPSLPRKDDRCLLLWCFSVPILWLFVLMGVVGSVYPNWGAPAHVAVVLLVTLLVIENDAMRLLRASLVLNVAVALLLCVIAGVPAIALPDGRTIPLTARLLGWSSVGERVSGVLLEQGEMTLLADDRRLLNLLGFYAYIPADRMVAWNPDGVPDNHIELTTMLSPGAKGPFLLVSTVPQPDGILTRFESVRAIDPIRVESAAGLVRQYWLFVLAGFKGY
jgi:4-amino-4-deoxy-L-arabinose transferase-like glycosyltransferase